MATDAMRRGHGHGHDHSHKEHEEAMAMVIVTAKSTATTSTATATAIHSHSHGCGYGAKKLRRPYLVRAEAANHWPASSAVAALAWDEQQAGTGRM